MAHSNHNSEQQVFRLRVATDLQALIPVLEWFDRTVRSRLSNSEIWEMKVALAEGFTNTVNYAHDRLPATTPIDIELFVSDNHLKIHIWNFGQPFDLQKKLAELEQSAADPLEKESERGLLLMRSLMDKLQYIRLEDGRNCLVMSKHIS